MCYAGLCQRQSREHGRWFWLKQQALMMRHMAQAAGVHDAPQEHMAVQAK